MSVGLDHGRLLASLLPPGPAWNIEEGSTLSKLLQGLGKEFARIDDKADSLVAEANPITMSQMLSVRYSEAGLPNLCRGIPNTVQEQIDEVVTKWAMRGGQSRSYFESVATSYGLDARVTEYNIFQIESTPIQTIGFDDAYYYAWNVNYVNTTTRVFRASKSHAGERLVEMAI